MTSPEKWEYIITSANDISNNTEQKNIDTGPTPTQNIDTALTSSNESQQSALMPFDTISDTLHTHLTPDTSHS